MKKNLSRIISDNTKLVDKTVEDYLAFDNRPYQRVIDSMRYSAYSGGKRIRPFLALEFCRMFGGSDESVLPYAVAIELIHTYSLIHDDMPCMDNDDFRRGKPTNHKQFDEATAMLAGDALLTYAFGVAASNGRVSCEHNTEAVKLLSDNAGFDGMVGGQMLDLIGETEKLSRDDFLTMNKLKTGCLIKTACQLGCIAAGYTRSTKEYETAEKYAERIGLAFQIEDDILDDGTEDNKTTFLSFMTVDEAKAKVRELTDGAKDLLSEFENSDVLCDFADYLAERTV